MAREVRIQHSYPLAFGFLQEHGPETLAVLHDLLARAERRGDDLVVEVSVRQIADGLGFLSKDTAHRRLRQLLRAGVIRHLGATPSSTFTRPVYVIDLTGTGISRSGSSARSAV